MGILFKQFKLAKVGKLETGNLLSLLLSDLLLEEVENESTILILLVDEEREEHHKLFKIRYEEGCYNLLCKGHLKTDDVKFRGFFRLNTEHILKDYLTKMGSNVVRNPISAGEKLAITVRFMATGESFRSLSYAFRVSHSYISFLVKETLNSICKHLVPMFLPPPTTDILKQNATDFQNKWNFPHCTMAIDGKHIRIICPINSGSLFFNYKKYFSIVLLAMVDANYKFVAVDMGSYGKEGDSGIFSKSAMGKLVYSGHFFPPEEKLAGLDKMVPYVIVGDEAFRLHKHLMKPYIKTVAASDKRKAIFNYRLSRAGRVSENAFGILCQVFRVFHTPIAVKPETCENLILAACCLHNLLRSGYLETNEKPFYEYVTNDVPTMCMVLLRNTGGYANLEGFQVREDFSDYFSQTGQVSWQNKHVSRLSS